MHAQFYGDSRDLQRGRRPPRVRRRAAAVSGGPDRNGRRGRARVELSTILIKYAFKIAFQFWAKQDNSVVPLDQALGVCPYLPVVRFARANNPCPGNNRDQQIQIHVTAQLAQT